MFQFRENAGMFWLSVMKMRVLCCSMMLLVTPWSAVLADPVIAVAAGDWNRDGERDAAMILEPGDGQDDNSLKIYLSDGPGGRLRLEVHAENFVWGSSIMAGQTPGLQALPNGSLAVTSLNESIGRNRWWKKLTIAWRKGRFIVAGFTYDDVDTLGDPDADGDIKPNSCDLNLVAGKGDINGKRRSFKPVIKGVKEWDDRFGHDLCEK